MVIGIRPIGLLRAFKISSSIFDSVLSASLPKAFKIVEIMKPLNKKAINNTNKDVIIDPRFIPKKPEFHTSETNLIKSFIISDVFYVELTF